MGILAVAHVLDLFELHAKPLGEEPTRAIRAKPGQIVRDGAVILRGMGKHLLRERQARGGGHSPGVLGHLRQDPRVVVRIDQHGDVGMILGRRAKHGGAADIDVLDGLVKGTLGAGHGRGEWIEVHRQDIDGADRVLLERRLVGGVGAPGEDAGMDPGVQRLDPSVEHFRKARVVGDLGHGDTLIAQQRGRAARR